MSSVNKTPNYNLPQWLMSEKPEMTDLNAAFLALDGAAKVSALASVLINMGADLLGIYDPGNLITAVTAGAALREIAQNVNYVKTAGAANPFTNMPYVGTAPIVESASNANGNYIKYADGTMICRGSATGSGLAVSLIIAPIYSCDIAIPNYPVAFYAVPHVVWGLNGVTSNRGLAVNTGYSGSTTHCNSGNAVNIKVYDAAAVSFKVEYIAIGRWKA